MSKNINNTLKHIFTIKRQSLVINTQVFTLFFRMNTIDLLHSWHIPTNTKSCDCRWCIYNPDDKILFPGIVNEITIKVDKISHYYIFHSIQHDKNKPWKLLNEYLYFNHLNLTLTIQIITSEQYHLKQNEPICHLKITRIQKILVTPKGNTHFF